MTNYWPFHLYLLIVFIIIIILNPHKNEGEKKIQKLRRNGKANAPASHPTQNCCVKLLLLLLHCNLATICLLECGFSYSVGATLAHKFLHTAHRWCYLLMSVRPGALMLSVLIVSPDRCYNASSTLMSNLRANRWWRELEVKTALAYQMASVLMMEGDRGFYCRLATTPTL